MGLFSKKTTDDTKKIDDKSIKVNDGGKDEKKDGKNMKKLYGDKKTEMAGHDKNSPKKVKYSNAYKVLVRPLVTEKASVMNSLNKYFFEVAKEANKIEIARAIQAVYEVNPISVNIVRMQGKRVRRGRTMGKRKDWKKAIITLKKGESIKVYEGV